MTAVDSSPGIERVRNRVGEIYEKFGYLRDFLEGHPDVELVNEVERAFGLLLLDVGILAGQSGAATEVSAPETIGDETERETNETVSQSQNETFGVSPWERLGLSRATYYRHRASRESVPYHETEGG